MKLSILKLTAGLFAAVLAIASTSPSLQAQTSDVRARVQVPFAFEVGNAHFAPGLYTFTMQSDRILLVRGQSASAFATTLWDTNNKPAAGKIVFRKYGDKYFLRQVWTSASGKHLECIPAKSERQAEKVQEAANQGRKPGVELASLQIPN